ncbi:MAG: L-threonine 3-dehydrogenase [Anaerolineae bacterium]
MAKMKALMKVQPTPGAELVEIDVPAIGRRDLLVKVSAVAICGTDNHIYDWTPYAQARVKLPMTFGHEFCGQVVEVGAEAPGFAVGDMVAGETHIPCGQCFQCQTGRQHTCESMAIVGVHTDGAFADYISLPAACAWKLPPDTSPELGAIMEPLGVAVHGVLADRVDGQSVAVFGCGPIGIFAAQVAQAAGARQLFVLDINPTRLNMALEVVPQAVGLNPAEDDVEGAIPEATEGRGVDVSIELSGSGSGTQQAFRVLRKGGRISLVGLPSEPVELEMTSAIIYREAKVLGVTGRVMWDTWWQMDGLLKAGAFDPTKVITHRFPLTEFEEALELTRSGQAGKVLLLP